MKSWWIIRLIKKQLFLFINAVYSLSLLYSQFTASSEIQWQIVGARPFPIVLVKCWKVAYWNAKKLLENCQNLKKLQTKFQKLPPKFLDIFI